MNKLSFLLLSLFLITSCKKESESETYQSINNKRDYVILDKTYTLTYNVTKEGRITVLEKTKDNLALFEYFKNNKNTTVHYDLATGKNEVHKDHNAFIATLKSGTPEINQLKSTKRDITFNAYHHPWFNTLANSSSVQFWPSSQLNSSERSRLIGRYFTQPERDMAHGFAEDYVGGGYDQITSLKTNQNLWSGNNSGYNKFHTILWEHAGWSGWSTAFTINNSQSTIEAPDLRWWVIQSFLWFNTTWNDRISSYEGYYSN
jgi:hypothetical protein